MKYFCQLKLSHISFFPQAVYELADFFVVHYDFSLSGLRLGCTFQHAPIIQQTSHMRNKRCVESSNKSGRISFSEIRPLTISKPAGCCPRQACINHKETQSRYSALLLSTNLLIFLPVVFSNSTRRTVIFFIFLKKGRFSLILSTSVQRSFST